MSKPYKRSIIIVDSKFQLRFSALICVVILVLSAFYPLVIYQVLTNISEKFPQSAEHIASMKTNLVNFLILCQAFFGILIFITCIFFTHKVAGPLYKLKQYLANLRHVGFERKLSFRDGDYFKDVADEVNLTVEYFQTNFKEDTVYIDEICNYLKNLQQVVPDDKKLILSDVVTKLKDMEGRFNEFIG